MKTAKARQYAKSKTINFGTLVAGLGALQVMFPELKAQIHPAVYPWALVAIGVGVVMLRSITEKPISEK